MNVPQFLDPKIKDLVFTHRSFLNESPSDVNSNERLEFLGDSILSFVVSTYIYSNYPHLEEGELTSLRSVLTNTQTLHMVAQDLKLGDLLMLSKGEEEGGGRESKTILANTYEAVVGGLFLDQGIAASQNFITETILSRIDEFIGNQGMKDAKSQLQEFMQEKFKTSPEYKILEENGPDHDKEYTSGVFLNERLLASGQGKSKQEAEKSAAAAALLTLEGN